MHEQYVCCIVHLCRRVLQKQLERTHIISMRCFLSWLYVPLQSFTKSSSPHILFGLPLSGCSLISWHGWSIVCVLSRRCAFVVAAVSVEINGCRQAAKCEEEEERASERCFLEWVDAWMTGEDRHPAKTLGICKTTMNKTRAREVVGTAYPLPL